MTSSRRVRRALCDAQVLLKYFCHVTIAKLHETEVSDVEDTSSEPKLLMRSEQTPTFCWLVVMSECLMLHWQLTLHMAAFWQLYAPSCSALQGCTERRSRCDCAFLSEYCFYVILLTGHSLWAPKASTSLIMLYTRQTIAICAWSYTDKLKFPATMNSCTFRLCDSYICSAQACLHFFQSWLQKDQADEQSATMGQDKSCYWLSCKQSDLLYVLMSAKAVLHHQVKKYMIRALEYC